MEMHTRHHDNTEKETTALEPESWVPRSPENPKTLQPPMFSGCTRLHPHPRRPGQQPPPSPTEVSNSTTPPLGFAVHLIADTQERSPQTVLLLDNLLHFRSRLQMTTLKIKVCQPNLQAFFQLAIIYTNSYKTT